MTESVTKHERNLSALIHASTFSKFFIPFGNFIIPLVLWTANKKEYEFVDHNGKQALNFQISILLYSILVGMVSIPFFLGGFLPNVFDFDNFGLVNVHSFNNINFHFDSDDFFGPWMIPVGLLGLAQSALFIINIVYTILATIKTNEGEVFEYPLSFKFIK
ncbi:DUF4870 domain-containing protein [Maribacter dokdonensis]|uniref:DUF4870 domain-containing protein n=1 Tax=Maribacter dokdonensis TaxID=320912 RepID=UPI0007199B7A|nr:DUF4870 domain-containing protein [Maribacter dokdonensis]KSA12105.1 hypothetical protein I600_3347 [Maribacter dokdonensis DSW-8]